LCIWDDRRPTTDDRERQMGEMPDLNHVEV